MRLWSMVVIHDQMPVGWTGLGIARGMVVIPALRDTAAVLTGCYFKLDRYATSADISASSKALDGSIHGGPSRAMTLPRFGCFGVFQPGPKILLEYRVVDVPVFASVVEHAADDSASACHVCQIRSL